MIARSSFAWPGLLVILVGCSTGGGAGPGFTGYDLGKPGGVGPDTALDIGGAGPELPQRDMGGDGAGAAEVDEGGLSDIGGGFDVLADNGSDAADSDLQPTDPDVLDEPVCQPERRSRYASCDGADNDCDGEVDEANAVGCVKQWVDEDGDYFGAGEELCFCEVEKGNVTRGDDCCDEDVNARPFQAVYFSTPNRCGDYDYNCSGREQRRWGSRGDCGFLCITDEGWENTIPDCGQTAEWLYNCTLGFSCGRETVTRRQQCR